MFQLPTTETTAYDFSKCLVDGSRCNALNSSRERVRITLKAEPNSSSLTSALQQYIPLALELMKQYETLSTDLFSSGVFSKNIWEFSWQGVLCLEKLRNLTFKGTYRPHYTSNNIHHELTYVFLVIKLMFVQS